VKYIAKRQCPECLQNFIDAQLAIEPDPVNVTYSSFPDKPRLLDELTREQYGLCGYTGAPVDAGRISRLQGSSASQVRFRSHAEHLKCQDICKQEVVSAGKVHGSVVGDDLNYQNMIAALEVNGSEVEQFGAAIKKNHSLPVLPTHANCQDHFSYRSDGGVDGSTVDGGTTAKTLKLDHKTLRDWRASAIEAWLPDEIIESKKDLIDIIDSLRQAVNGNLPEYAFIIEAIALRYL